jgi:selenocysteine-specific elongation factor
VNAPAPLILGTAGHVDHGKTRLIRALTGVDTDRLPEERERGISIELGYARLQLPSGRNLSVIDVPGHERFVRTMVAGATGIDLYVMAIAADDGVMPQTREHAAVLRALDVQRGVVAVTRSDLTSAEPALREAQELMPDAELVAVSACTGAGVGELLAALERVAAGVAGRPADNGAARLHVDRVFTVRGAGAVVTGTLWSGSLSPGAQVDVLPAGTRARVRAIQVHGQPVQVARAGERVALNLTGKATRDLARGDVVTTFGSDLAPSYRLDCDLEFGEREPAHGERVQVHHGTRESPARMSWLGGRFWQVRLENPLVAVAGDRLVVRQIAPPDTLGGGVILDPGPRKHGPSRELLIRLAAVSRGEPPRMPGGSPVDEARPAGAAPLTPKPEPTLSESALALEQRLHGAHLEPPPDADLDPRDLSALRAAGRAVRVSKTLHYHAETLAQLRSRVIELAARSGGMITLAQLRDELGTSRKFAQALLEHFDAERVTIRRGAGHYLRGGSASASGD